MQTKVTKRGKTSIPAAIRRGHQIHAGARLAWIDEGQTIFVVPVPSDPITTLEGSAKGEQLAVRLLAERRMDALY